MKNVSTETATIIEWNVQRIWFYFKKTDSSDNVEDITNDILTVNWYTEFNDDNWILTKDSLEIWVSNIKNDKQEFSALWKYENPEILKDNIELNVRYWVNPNFLIWNGKIYDINWMWSNNNTLWLTLISQEEINSKIIKALQTNIRPVDLIKNIIENDLWKTFTIFWDVTDEDDRKIKYVSYYKDDMFYELNKLVEYSRWKLYWDSYENSYIYYTESQINTKLDSWTNNDREFLSYNVLDYEISIDKSNLYNNMIWTLYNYEIKNNFDFVFINVALESWETVNIDKRFWKWEIWESFSSILISATTWEDWTWYDAATNDESKIERNLNFEPTWVNWTIKNNYSEKLYCTVAIRWTAKIATWSEVNKIDQTSIDNYWNKRKTYDNKYFQDPVYLDYFLKQELNQYKNPKEYYLFDIVADPRLQLMDKVRFNLQMGDGSTLDIIWLTRRLEFNIDVNNWFTMWVWCYKIP